MLYSTYLGGGLQGSDNPADGGSAIAVDSAGDAYVTGYAASQNFPVTSDAYQDENSGDFNAFVTVFDPSGSALLYSTYLGGSAQDYGNGIALDSNGNVYVAGQAYSSNFPVTIGAFQTANKSHPIDGSNAFVTKFVPGGATTMTLVSSGNPQNHGVKITFTATVSTGTEDGTPTGNVAFTIDNLPATTVALSKGVAMLSIASLSVGVHTIQASYSGDLNYGASQASLTETIAGAAAGISVYSGSGQTAVYGSSLGSPLIVVVRDANEVPVSGVPVSFTGTGLALSGASVVTNASGLASVTAKATATGMLDAIATAIVDGVEAGAFFDETGEKAVLTVTANNLSVPYDQPIPALTYTTTGFVNGNSSSVVSGTPVLTTTAKEGWAPGTYPITVAQGTLAATNYTFKLVNGTLSIASLGTVATPSFSPVGGTYSSMQSVKLADGTNGATPTTSSTKYTRAITVSATETIKAVAVAPGHSDRAVASATYTIK